VNADELLFGTNRVYGAIHQFGGTIEIAARSQQAYYRQKKNGEIDNQFVRKSNQTLHSGTPFRPTKLRSPPARGWVCQKQKGKPLSIWRKTTCRGRLTDVAVRRPVTRSGGRLATMTQSTLATRIIIRFNTVPGPVPPRAGPQFYLPPHFYLPVGRLPLNTFRHDVAITPDNQNDDSHDDEHS
jgi:hypothetical protein